MVVLAGILLVGLWRAKARSEAREAFTLTPVLIGGTPAALQPLFLAVLSFVGWGWASGAGVLCACCSFLPACPLPANCFRPLPAWLPPCVPAVGCQLFLCWLLYFYTASAMRESVLKVNGSHIRPW
jgi:hypothetical protein